MKYKMKNRTFSYTERAINGKRYSLTSHLSPLTSILTSYLLPLTSYLFLSCEKDINLDYHQVTPLYVVEASISNNGTEVRLSTTNAMDDNSSASELNAATVTISAADGTNHEIPNFGNGRYRTAALKGVAGTEYRIDVEVDGHHFTSTSTMQREPTVNSFRLVWKKVATERFMFGDLKLKDIPNEDNWYFLHIYRNNIGYRWAVMRDNQNPNKELQQLFSFFREGSNDSDVLRDGDRLRIEVRAIDQRAYDYLYSMQIMDNTGTNPIDNFTGGCLGYFSAFHQVTLNVVYHEADAEEDDA